MLNKPSIDPYISEIGRLILIHVVLHTSKLFVYLYYFYRTQANLVLCLQDELLSP
jgi:hypothetical protein